VGFYDKNSSVSFNISPHADSSSMLEPFPGSQEQYVGKDFIEVQRLDDFMKRESIKKIDFLKIDVEGVEKELLIGGIETLKHRVDNLFIEISLSKKGIYSSNYIDVLKLINTAGFALVQIWENENFFFTKLIRD
jgi:hypothetical protein